MKKMILIGIIIMFLGVFSQTSFGCSCFHRFDSGEKTPEEIKELKKSERNYYLNKFKGAIFVGKVLSVEKVNRKIHDKFIISERKVVFKVEKYWIGVESDTITIYTGMGGGDCGIKFQEGDITFVKADNYEDRFMTGICSYSYQKSRRLLY